MECGLGLFPPGWPKEPMDEFLETSEKPHNCGLSREPMVLRLGLVLGLGLGFMVRLSINHFLIIYIYIYGFTYLAGMILGRTLWQISNGRKKNGDLKNLQGSSRYFYLLKNCQVLAVS
jgi:hypothetical protein